MISYDICLSLSDLLHSVWQSPGPSMSLQMALFCSFLWLSNIRKDTCTPVFTAALFTIARTWKQPKCPSTGEWIKKMWHIYTMEYYSATKKNKIMPFVYCFLPSHNGPSCLSNNAKNPLPQGLCLKHSFPSDLSRIFLCLLQVFAQMLLSQWGLPGCSI